MTLESIESVRKTIAEHMDNQKGRNALAMLDNIEAEIAEKYILKDESKLEENAVQEYNVTVQVAAGQTIEYNTELRHRCGAATSMSVAFRLE